MSHITLRWWHIVLPLCALGLIVVFYFFPGMLSSVTESPSTSLLSRDEQATSSDSGVPQSVIPYARLAREEELPFLVNGRRPEPDYPAYHSYQKAIVRFPDVRSCLLAQEHSTSASDLSLFNWNAINTLEDMDVCLFRVASSIGTIDGIRGWLVSQGFVVTTMTMPLDTGTSLDVSWNIKEKGARFSASIFDKWYQEIIAHSMATTILLDPKGRVLGVRTTFTIL